MTIMRFDMVPVLSGRTGSIVPSVSALIILSLTIAHSAAQNPGDYGDRYNQVQPQYKQPQPQRNCQPTDGNPCLPASGDRANLPPSSNANRQAMERNGEYPQDPCLPSSEVNELNDQQPCSAFDFQPCSETTRSRMSAEQITQILHQQPSILAEVKNDLGRQQGLDPSSISDELVYAKVQRDPSVRDEVGQELVTLGFVPNTAPDANQNTGSMQRKSLNGEPCPTPSSNYSPNNLQQDNNDRYRQPRPYVDRDNPQVTRQQDPYRHLPSLDDLYSQFPATTEKVSRFGADAFRTGTWNSNPLSIDLPVGSDYVVGPGDSLVLNLWGGQSNQLSRQVDRQGQVAIPEVGNVSIQGLTIDQAEIAVQKALATQFKNVHVQISLGRVRSIRIYVVGDVQRPGAYDISSLSTPLNALYAAGGPADRGSLRLLRQYRNGKLVGDIDLYDFLLRGVHTGVNRLMPGDTLLVPPVGGLVTVSGMVRRPAVYELNGEKKLSEILDLAGGVLVSANLKQIRVERISAHQRRTMLNLQMPEDGSATSPELAAFTVQDGDNVAVSQIAPYNEQMVYLQGHVFHPGKYPWKDNMVLTDLVHSYQDVMPEAADHAEIIRLVPPEFQPETIPFNLREALSDKKAILLLPFDLVRIFGRYEIDPPKVTISGEVLRPGEYPMPRNLSAAALVRMAGGFKRDAYREQADLSSYEIKNGKTVLTHHQVVDIDEAFNGDQTADVVLKPGDILTVRQLTGWQDIGASVVINGEVIHAGTYGIENGEKLSSVLMRAGGLRDSAYPAGAVLERVQVRQIAENARLEMIRRIETTPISFKPGLLSGQDQADTQQAAQLQREQVLAALRNHPASGRMVINISPDINVWKDTPADIEMRPGDTLLIPKVEYFVIVSGQVFNPTAVTYSPGKNAGWYLRQAGGVTRSGDKSAAYIVRANGSIVSRGGRWSGDVLNARLKPGDTVIVPEKVIGSQIWKNVLATAQIMSSVAITGAVAGVF